ncbi:hypothetical protein MMC26_002703 [Xylographa opegraphella]|nr:hypothetical protein [Xylographa opegraphella]
MVDKAPSAVPVDAEAVERLNAQSYFLRVLHTGHPIHASIPKAKLRAIADVATVMGVWMDEAQQELRTAAVGSEEVRFTGFDVSDALFPRQVRPGQTFVVHDFLQPFPDEYREQFDLVHLRFLGAGMRACQLEDLVEWVIEILRPGGYLQWQGLDAIDVWTVPETSMAKQMIYWLVRERLASGLAPAWKTGAINPMCWTDALLRIYHLETISTADHPCAEVHCLKHQWTLNFLIPLLETCAAARAVKAKEPRLPWHTAEMLVVETARITRLVQTMKHGPDGTLGGFDLLMTRIVARKAKVFPQNGPWLAEWHSTEGYPGQGMEDGGVGGRSVDWWT